MKRTTGKEGWISRDLGQRRKSWWTSSKNVLVAALHVLFCPHDSPMWNRLQKRLSWNKMFRYAISRTSNIAPFFNPLNLRKIVRTTPTAFSELQIQYTVNLLRSFFFLSESWPTIVQPVQNRFLTLLRDIRLINKVTIWRLLLTSGRKTDHTSVVINNVHFHSIEYSLFSSFDPSLTFHPFRFAIEGFRYIIVVN